MGQNYEGLFESWEIAVAKNLVDEFLNKWDLLEREGFEDLLQECLTHWFFVKKEYDPQREASESTFMSRIVRHKLINIVDRVYADKRKAFYQSVPLEQPLDDNEDSSTLIEMLPDKTQDSENLCIYTQLKIALSKVMPKLTEKQQKLCRLLSEEGMSIKAASENLKIPRGTIYEEIKRIRAIFRKENLKEYLK